MRIAVAGAGGFLGLAVVRAAVEAGDEVRGLVPRPGQLARVESAGGTPILADLTTSDALPTALAGCDAVVHVAHSGADLDRMRSVRVEGGRRLARAVVASGVRRVVVGSGYWIYASSATPLTESSPIAPLGLSAINFETEQAVDAELRSAGRPPPVILRPGMVYGPGSWLEAMVGELRSGEYRYLGDGANYLSPVPLDDTGRAFRLAAERAPPGERYLVVDDEPVATRAFAEFVADRIGAAPPRSIDPDRAVPDWGADLVELNRRSRPASNRKLRALGWTPRSPSFRTGLPPVLEAMGPGRPAAGR